MLRELGEMDYEQGSRKSGSCSLHGIDEVDSKVTQELTEHIRITFSDCLVDYAAKPWVRERSADEWIEIFEGAAIFQGEDALLWGRFLACIYREPRTKKLSCLFFDKLGVVHLNSLDLSSSSRFYPAIENLIPEYRTQNVRKCLAVGLLKKFALINPSVVKKIREELPYDYDQTAAGDLANACDLVGYCTPSDLGKSLVNLGFLQARFIQSVLLDVIYHNKEELVNANNQLVYYLGEQLEQLFDPLTEYSPEQTESCYKPPDYDLSPQVSDGSLIVAICKELLQVQTNFTMSLVEFLQKFLIPLRIAVLNDQVPGLSTLKLNRLFPPTIDEVTRINCIFLDALKAATPYGSLEVIKACGITIPYFYKAYTRHEAATKNFNKDIKLFMNKFGKIIPFPNVYTQVKLDSIIRGPQEKLTKLKLIIERLHESKEWGSAEESSEAERNFSSICDVIDSFGNNEPTANAYSTRVFTPSGKILTELAKGWPPELQYRWLKRRVVGVFDVVAVNNDSRRDILVIFSDYIVFLNIINGDLYYMDGTNKPLISDILMNSLINEVQLPPRIPTLQVNSHNYIDDVVVSTFQNSMIRFDTLNKDKEPTSVIYKLASSSISPAYVADLCTKAKILEKDTAFHLFKATSGKFRVYSTAHELEAYKSETIKSNLTLCLNIEPSVDLLQEFGATVGLFATLKTNGNVKIERLDIKGKLEETTVSIENFLNLIIEELVLFYSSYFSSSESPLFPKLLKLNENLVRSIGRNFNAKIRPGPSKAVVQGLGKDPKSLFRAVHKKTKSYATISTFKSDNSDMKDIPMSVKSADNDTSRHQKGRKDPRRKNKRESFFGKLSGLFQKKRPTENKEKSKQPEVRSSNRNPYLASNVSLDNIKSYFSRDDKPKKSMYDAIAIAKQNRISSVARNSIVVLPKGISTNIIISEAKESEEQDTVKSPSDKSIKDSILGSDVIGQTTITEDTTHNTDLRPRRQSQLFSGDLYGDLIPALRGQNTDMEATSRESLVLVKSQSNLASKLESPIKAEIQSIHSAAAQYDIQKMQIERSPSFTELFGSMRLVLDDNDDNANWRRLSSEKSLNGKYRINPTERLEHEFDLLPNSVKNPSNDKMVIIQSTSVAKSDRVSKPPSIKSEFLDSTLNKEVTVANVKSATNHTQTGKSQREEQVSSALRGRATHLQIPESTAVQTKSNKRSRSPGFVVTKTSPTKIWTSEKLYSKISDVKNETTDASVVSSLRKPNRRLFELSINSREDLNEEQITSNTGQPVKHRVGSQMNQTNFSEAITTENGKSNYMLSREVIDLTHDESGRPSYIQNNQAHTSTAASDALLDELDFSAFHMSFQETSSDGIVTPGGNTLPKSLLTTNTAAKYMLPQEPIFYRLPENKVDDPYIFNLKRDQIKVSTSTSIPKAMDDALWVSPSKLDIFDLSKQPDSVYRRTKLPETNGSFLGRLARDSSAILDNPLLDRDSSYMYLSKYVGTDDIVLCMDENEDDTAAAMRNPNEKPQRLTFIP
ncbi:Bud3p Ecym_1300 [Eremothecium cymbalariae DBVPG|uniref:DH domain-containing protein n=1 Tax=Eremothecium cymbalariae (strain CBS 270.75 / DBVPG 7215 / KCTC 17166 / NRRL Y-17582) TaxID=931890 RepID=G8JN74_ERECY|nr:hypothetical protein Ecym_1300 [Eremothecium cymbalariae DBVPG\